MKEERKKQWQSSRVQGSVRRGADVRGGVLRITIRGSLLITAGFVPRSKKGKKKIHPEC